MMRGTPLERFNNRWVGDCNSGCWLWLGPLNHEGYGIFGVRDGKAMTAHRFAYTTLVGEVPAGLQLDHTCRVRCCCNPNHLRVVTCRENLMSGNTLAAANAAKTRCINGHAFDERNTGFKEGGKERRCRKCDARYAAAYRLAHPERVRATLERYYARKREAHNG